jgi:hypothetical protein
MRPDAAASKNNPQGPNVSLTAAIASKMTA